MAPFVDGLRRRGLEAIALSLPKRRAEDALGAFYDQVPDEADVVVGGHSFGGRVASLAAASGRPVLRRARLLQLSASSARRPG